MLAHSIVAAPGRAPEKLVMFLHGMLGQGNNWRGFARRLVEANPGWGAVLVDLRCHGRSLDEAPPDTGRQAARDLMRLDVASQATVVVGHSFGGKVALHYVDERGGELAHAVIVDANPGPRAAGRGSESTLAIVEALATLKGPFPDRAAFVAEFTKRGHTREIADWLAMNLEERDGAQWFRLNIERIQALLTDHFETDLWHLLEQPPADVALSMVIGGKSDAFDAAERARVAEIAAASDGRVEAVTIADAGHWVHVDAPTALLAVVKRALANAG